ncbi:MAG: zinc ABC transporter substrate-binding protein [Patescibacteria group bacterium]
MKKNIVSLVVILVVVVGVVFAAGRSAKEETVQTDRLVVATSFYPLYYFASQIAGEHAEVVNLGQNSDPHDFTPSAADIVTLQGADLVLLQGAGLESWGEDAEHQLGDAGVPVFVVAEHISLHRIEEDELDLAHEGEGADQEPGVEDGHVDGEFDPHTWLDPVLAAETVTRIAEELASIDPAHEDTYLANARILSDELVQLDVAYRTSFTTCTADEVLVSHDAFGYIARRYNLTMHPIAGISTQDEPSAALLAKLKEEAQEGVLAILTEENSVKEYAETLSRETGVSLLSVSTLEAGGTAGGDYMDGMRANLEILKQGYGCTE